MPIKCPFDKLRTTHPNNNEALKIIKINLDMFWTIRLVLNYDQKYDSASKVFLQPC